MIVKYLGIGGLGLTALWIGRGYSAYADRRLGEMGGISALILHIESRLGRTLDYGAELYRGFDDEFLEKCGFLPLLREGKPLYDAFSEAKTSMILPDEVADIVENLFSSFGKGYKDQEIERLRMARAELDNKITTLREESDKNKRVVNALLFGITASGAILLM
ncbi:MAG: hypothetical protein IKU99_00485 [Clostridia bacterium]|nr:hypothetical protein [Clostridia bacterium]